MRGLLTRAVLAGFLLVLLGVGPALAHGDLLEGAPGPGGTVAPGLDVLALTFESVDPDGPHYLALMDQAGEPVAVGAAVGADGQTVCAASAPLQQGVHTLEYDVAGDDGHSVPGKYTFEVVAGGDPAGTGPCSRLDLAAPGEAQTLQEMRTGSVRPLLVYGLAALVAVTGGLAGWRLWRERRAATDPT